MITKNLKIKNKTGLHARPASLISKIVRQSKSKVTLDTGNRRADANSVLELMTLAAAKDTHIIMIAKGSDEKDVANKIAEAFENKFKEAYNE